MQYLPLQEDKTNGQKWYSAQLLLRWCLPRRSAASEGIGSTLFVFLNFPYDTAAPCLLQLWEEKTTILRNKEGSAKRKNILAARVRGFNIESIAKIGRKVSWDVSLLDRSHAGCAMVNRCANGVMWCGSYITPWPIIGATLISLYRLIPAAA